MTYVLTIYFIFTFGVASIQELTLDLATCKAEVAKILLELNPPPFIKIRARCTSIEYGMEV